MSGLLSNALSGLQSSQNALRTAGHNISNANTAGYTRQQVNYATRPEQYIGSAGFIGSGVTTTSIERVVNEFVTAQLRLDTTTFNQLDAFNNNIGKIDKLFSDTSTGLSGALQTFFAAMQNGANDPASTPARQLVVTEAESLSVRFNNLHQRLSDIEKSINGELKAVTSQISSLAKSVAELNQSIGEKVAAGNGNMPNDLMDKRDEALRQLSELVSIQVVKQDDGDLNVFIGNGQPLVVGASVSAFNVTHDGTIQITGKNSAADITAQISGGKLGGLLEFRESVLRPALNEMGRIALAMADEFNTLQQQGIDLDGDYGQPIFGDINAPEIAKNRVIHGDNKPPFDRNLSVTIENIGELTISDYQFDILPGSSNYVITRLSDKAVVNQGTLSGAYPTTISFDGISLNLNGGSFQGGDTFILQPTKNGARDIHAEIKRPEDLAFASPIRTASSTSNSGSGLIGAGEVLGLVDANGNRLPAFANPGQLTPPLLIRFTSETTYEVLDNTDPGNPKPLVPAMREQIFIPGSSNNIFTSDVGETIVIGKGDRIGLPEGRSPQTVMSLTDPLARNGYLAEQLRFTITDPETGSQSIKTITTVPGASALETAAQISAIAGVSARASTTANITNLNLAAADLAPPTQLYINGKPLIQYDTAGTAFHSAVPDFSVQGEAAFNDYLAEQINANPDLKTLGIRAQSSTNPNTGAPELRLVASSGVDLDIRLQASSASGMDVNDANGNPNVRLVGADTGAGELQGIVVGGKVDITMANGISLSTAPTNSPLFGDSSAAGFAASSYTGFQVAISGQPKAGDTFTVGFNTNGKNDNRNALAMVALESKKLMQDGTLTLDDGYGKLVEEVGTRSSLSKINTEASKSLLEQSQNMRDSISDVNLDEQPGDLIKFQQLYQANAQVISVARELFDTLLSSL